MERMKWLPIDAVACQKRLFPLFLTVPAPRADAQTVIALQGFERGDSPAFTFNTDIVSIGIGASNLCAMRGFDVEPMLRTAASRPVNTAAPRGGFSDYNHTKLELSISYGMTSVAPSFRQRTA